MTGKHTTRTLQIADKRLVARDVVELVLAAPDGARLPDWTPGAHIDLILPDGTSRQYSLAGDPRNAREYRVSLLREHAGRGGSAYIHDQSKVGDLLRFGGPRNNFPLVPSPRYLFIAGGIGITPILPMLRAASELHSDFELLYLGREEEAMAHRPALETYGDRVVVHASRDSGRLDLRTAIGSFDESRKVYACGPARLLDAVAELTGSWPAGWSRAERFSAVQAAAPTRSSPFEVRAAASGVSVVTGVEESIADALRRVGVDVLTSCNSGVCGTCETTVLGGTPDHRDSILDASERASNDWLFPCVSRSVGSLLTLDI